MIEIYITKKAEKGLIKLPKGAARRVVSKIHGLQKNPRPPGSRKIVGSVSDFRIRRSLLWLLVTGRIFIKVIEIVVESRI